jgi:lipopolysaccharide biosynthesis regulator YciM
MLLESIEVYLLNDLRHTLDGKQADDWHADKALDLAAQLQKVEDEEMRRKVADIYPALRSRQPR